MTLVYTWSGSAYLGAATYFKDEGYTVWGQVIKPNAAGTALFAQNKVDPLGTTQVDVVVGNSGKTPPLTIICYADWNPQYAAGTSPKLQATSYDSTGKVVGTWGPKTISPGSCYPALGCKSPCTCSDVPTTTVATITYNADGTLK